MSDNFSARDPQGDPEQLESVEPTDDSTPAESSSADAEQPVTESDSEAEGTEAEGTEAEGTEAEGSEAEGTEAEGAASSEPEGADSGEDFEVDLGSDSFGTTGDDVEINLDFASESTPGADPDDDGIDLNFGAPEEPEAEEEPEEEEEDESEDQTAALEAFRTELRAKFGEWYVVHTYSGMENRVLQNLENRVTSLNMEDFIFEIVVPTEEVTEIRNGQRKLIKRTVLPGYVLVRMDLTDESWSTVRHTPSVTGFVGHSNQPVPLSLEEVEKMLAPGVLAAAAAASVEAGAPKKKKKIEVADFAVGDSVMVVDGPFAGVHATITEINVNSQRLKALVEILGRETPVDLEFPQIQKV